MVLGGRTISPNPYDSDLFFINGTLFQEFDSDNVFISSKSQIPWRSGDSIRTVLFVSAIMTNGFLISMLLVQCLNANGKCCSSSGNTADVSNCLQNYLVPRQVIRRRFLQRPFLASLALADIFGAVGVFCRVLLPRLGVPFLCNEFPSVIFLRLSNLMILFSLAGCSLDHCLAVLRPLFHRTRSQLLNYAYTGSTIAMWLICSAIIGVEFLIPIRLDKKCVDSNYPGRKAGILLHLWNYNGLRDFCTVFICHHNYIYEIVQFCLWMLIAAVILLCYTRLMMFLINRRSDMMKRNQSQLTAQQFRPTTGTTLNKTNSEIISATSVRIRSPQQRLASISRSYSSMSYKERINRHKMLDNTPAVKVSKSHSESESDLLPNIVQVAHQQRSAANPLKGVVLTVGVIVTFVIIWFPRMVVEITSAYVDFQSTDFWSRSFHHALFDSTEILLLVKLNYFFPLLQLCSCFFYGFFSFCLDFLYYPTLNLWGKLVTDSEETQ